MEVKGLNADLGSVAAMDEEKLGRTVLCVFSTLLLSNLRTAWYNLQPMSLTTDIQGCEM